MPRLAVGLEYEGGAFCGWQSQANGCGVQDIVQKALLPLVDKNTLAEDAPPSQINSKITAHAAGRTDSGVHAALQIMHVDFVTVRPPEVWRRAINGRLPSAVQVLWACEVSSEFHARYSACRRIYAYYVSTAPSPPAILHGRLLHYEKTLSEKPLVAALELLRGTHDFSAFRAASCQAHTPMRELSEVSLRRRDDIWEFRFCANGFLHHMVRNIMGALFLVGNEQRPPQWIGELLAGKDRRRAPAPAAAHGLYLCGAEYPPNFALPESVRTVLGFEFGY